MKAYLERISTIIASMVMAGSCTAQSLRLTTSTAGLPSKGLAFGISVVGNINFSIQAYPAKGATFQKNSCAFPTGELLASYTGPHGWRMESGLGLGSVAAVTLDNRQLLGPEATVSFGTVQVPLRLYRYLALGPESRFSIGPHIGAQVVTLLMGERQSSRYPIDIANPAYGSQSQQFYSVRTHTLTYQVGASCNYVAPNLELNAFVRYTNSFGNPTVAEGQWAYDLQSIEQPPLLSRSRLENVAVGIVMRHPFYSR